MKKLLSATVIFFFLSLTGKAGVYYWVGGTGNWSQFNTHWATTSGGLVFHVQTPTPNDIVIFDANSFTANGQIVWVDSTFINCKSMDWTGVQFMPEFKNLYSSSNNVFKIYGSLTTIVQMSWSYAGTVSFEGNSILHMLTNAGHTFGGVAMNGTGTLSLQDSLTCGNFNMQAGTFKTNNQTVHISGGFNFLNSATVLLGTSMIYCGPHWNGNSASAFTIDADSCTFYLGGAFFGGTGKAYHNVIAPGGGYLYFDNCTFDFISFPTGGMFHGAASNNTIDSLYCGGSLDIGGTGNHIKKGIVVQQALLQGGNVYDHLIVTGTTSVSATGNIFHYIRMDDNASINGTNSFDTLDFNTPGKTLTLESGKTQTINNKLIINSNGGFPVTLQSNQPGTQATISKATDTVCVNYILMQDIKAIGGAQFYAGQYSTNISNNTGWNWMDCQQAISNVWPGDANYDLMTDNLDIIYIGIAYNETGLTRPGASNTYVAQPAMDWSKIYTNLVNLKHADSDGNGVVNANDTLAVSLNYGLANTGRMAAPQTQKTNSGTDIYFAPTQSVYAPGTWASIPINLGTSSSPASNVYGLAFTINYDATQIQAGTVSVSYGSSWLVGGGNLVHLEKDFYAQSKIDVGMSRISHANISGNGTIAYLNFQVANTAVVGPINLGFSNVTAMSYNQSLITTNNIGSSVTVGIENISSVASNVTMFPNPFSNETNVAYSLSTSSQVEVSVYSVDGSRIQNYFVASQSPGNHQLKLNTSSLPSGVYFCKVKFSNGEKVFKLIKTE